MLTNEQSPKVDLFHGLNKEELNDLARKIQQSSSVEDAYTLMAGQTEDGTSNYYDRLMTIQHQIIYDNIEQIFRKTQFKKAKLAVDVGTGTGNALPAILSRSKNVIAIDQNAAMLARAQEKMSSRHLQMPDPIQYKKGNVLELSLPPRSVDFVFDNGLMAYFTQEERDAYWNLVNTWLKSAGSYYTITSEARTNHLFEGTEVSRAAGIVIEALIALSHAAEQRLSPIPFEKSKEYGFSRNLHAIALVPYKIGVVQWVKIK